MCNCQRKPKQGEDDVVVIVHARAEHDINDKSKKKSEELRWWSPASFFEIAQNSERDTCYILCEIRRRHQLSYKTNVVRKIKMCISLNGFKVILY